MIAKYDGNCAVTGQPITAGETEIERFGTKWALAEYAGTRSAAAYAIECLNEALELVKQADHRTEDIERHIQKMNDLINVDKSRVRPDMIVAQALREAKQSAKFAREDLGE